MRPRDILNFVRKAIRIAVSRDHAHVMEIDVLAAERSFSEDMIPAFIIHPAFRMALNPLDSTDIQQNLFR
jgi:hypothetical protein